MAAEPIPIQKIFENEHVVAVLKPHGCLSTPARDSADPRPCLGRDLQSQLGIQIFPIHRLDFEVGGLILFAKTREAHRVMQKWFEDSVVQKTYQALSQPGSDSSSFADWLEWKSKLVKGKRRTFEAPYGKDSFTKARLKSTHESFWLWELIPLTGRPHQLRFEMSKHGFPIVGDKLYGGTESKPSWIGLRACVLDFSKVACDQRFGLPDRFVTTDLTPP